MDEEFIEIPDEISENDVDREDYGNGGSHPGGEDWYPAPRIDQYFGIDLPTPGFVDGEAVRKLVERDEWTIVEEPMVDVEVPASAKIDLQSVAEAVHLAIRLIEDAIHDSACQEQEPPTVYLSKRVEAVRDELKPAMMILAPYMPSPIGEMVPTSKTDLSGVTEAPDGPAVDSRKCWRCGKSDVPGDKFNHWCDDCLEASERDQDGYLDGGDEKSYSARRA
jgi:hypothetical protein